jgi:hypothetical protein
MRATLVALATFAPSALGAVPADRVTNLPGFGAPLSDLFSGYLTAAPNQRLHYVFSAAISVDPSTAPVVVWRCVFAKRARCITAAARILTFSSFPQTSSSPFLTCAATAVRL